MSCVNYWNECTNNDCKNVDYDRYPLKECVKCGADNHTIREWDEEGDHED